MLYLKDVSDGQRREGERTHTEKSGISSSVGCQSGKKTTSSWTILPGLRLTASRRMRMTHEWDVRRETKRGFGTPEALVNGSTTACRQWIRWYLLAMECRVFLYKWSCAIALGWVTALSCRPWSRTQQSEFGRVSLQIWRSNVACRGFFSWDTMMSIYNSSVSTLISSLLWSSCALVTSTVVSLA